jgi:hypothetical protein
MSQEQNGEANTPPSESNYKHLTVLWDPQAQDVCLSFDVGDFRTWEFVSAVLGMALEKAKFNVNYGNAQRARVAEMQKAQEDAIRRRIIQGG